MLFCYAVTFTVVELSFQGISKSCHNYIAHIINSQHNSARKGDTSLAQS